MSYCPICRFEYKSGIDICPDCNETLVDTLRPHSSAAVVPDDSWVVVGGISSEIESHMAKGSLDSNNIPSMIMPSNFSRTMRGFAAATNFLSGPDGNQEMIMVPREFADEATLILNAVLGDDFTELEIR